MPRISTLVLTTGLIVAAAPCAFSDEDPRYPAHDFKPSVIYQNPELIAEHDSNASSDSSSDAHHDPRYPGSAFTPTVIYQNPEFIRK